MTKRNRHNEINLKISRPREIKNSKTIEWKHYTPSRILKSGLSKLPIYWKWNNYIGKCSTSNSRHVQINLPGTYKGRPFTFSLNRSPKNGAKYELIKDNGERLVATNLNNFIGIIHEYLISG